MDSLRRRSVIADDRLSKATPYTRPVKNSLGCLQEGRKDVPFLLRLAAIGLLGRAEGAALNLFDRPQCRLTKPKVVTEITKHRDIGVISTSPNHLHRERSDLK